MYSQTVHGMQPYNPYSMQDDSHLRQRTSPVYSYSQQPRPYMPYNNSSPSKSSHHHYHSDEDDFYLEAHGYTIVPTVPTPVELTSYEYGRTPTGRVLVTSGNQTVEFFSGVVNCPPCYME
ncbi:hypothetical protein DYB37_002128 [Aphanomyces astaci]|uniref:Uncharacterized protein n=1 Tax=Aphanomyces astaci TaxID=112090 RepID=A0A397DTG0_APHAT|nr:hypothetical protein AaE_015200 [Aphanomyces astaci]RHX96614.1 hypothetical protein DYB25_005666 [Aphanomyces astaci]RHY38298.1 hypothetical protein DYB34_004286 [Aphanomyces astaci]RHY70778.1 hypothetical protein DYB30_007152 [Aphanomyces astaci]RHY70786.1 hypothetical protein DYB38_008409 [Aphanomyces astaci]